MSSDYSACSIDLRFWLGPLDSGWWRLLDVAFACDRSMDQHSIMIAFPRSPLFLGCSSEALLISVLFLMDYPTWADV